MVEMFHSSMAYPPLIQVFSKYTQNCFHFVHRLISAYPLLDVVHGNANLIMEYNRQQVNNPYSHTILNWVNGDVQLRHLSS